jgi:hypothetical protein
MQRHFFLFFILFLHSISNGYSSEEKIITQAKYFFAWLESHRSEFIHCKTEKIGDNYKLCDGTEVQKPDLVKLFKLGPSELIKELKGRGIKVEILCDPNSTAPKTFQAECLSSSNRKMFKEMTSLHGQYLPDERCILLRSSALKGSLIHEYIHFLQSENKMSVYGKVYKNTKNQIKKNLSAQMDKFILNVQRLEKAGKKAELESQVKAFMNVSDLMRNFAPWQDLIDEREIFLLYLEYGNEFGVEAEDKALAQKNMGFICKSKAWTNSIPAHQCALK